MKIAMRELENYREFKSPFIINSIDDTVLQDVDGGKTFYILLPYFESGSLQDLINGNALDGKNIEESEAIRLFVGICRGLQGMHRHQVKKHGDYEIAVGDSNQHAIETDALLNESESISGLIHEAVSLGEDDYEDVAQRDGDVTELGDIEAFAHRDIKPANVMLSKDGIPVLCDLGSCSRAKIKVSTRSQALTLQDFFAEHCTLPYRAPELLDVQTGSLIDEKVDIWSLGCTLYALLFGCSPFEYEEMENGGNMNMAIGSAKFEFPRNKTDIYSDDVKELITWCLTLEVNDRPRIEQVLQKALEIQRSL
jgi:serine/threonine kinase 16